MILLDTDMLTLLLQGHPRVQKRMHSAETDVATTIVTWMEVMQGRFRAIFTAADADQLERGLPAAPGIRESIEHSSYRSDKPCGGQAVRSAIGQQEAQTDRSRGHIDRKYCPCREGDAYHS